MVRNCVLLLLVAGMVANSDSFGIDVPPQPEPVLESKTCKFGKPVPGTCGCDSKEGKPICGSDTETYKNECEFQCALNCNPGLFKFEGDCPPTGGVPDKPRLNFADREKKKIQVEEVVDEDLHM